MSKIAILWCREDEGFGILVFLDYNGKCWEETRVTRDVGRFPYFTIEEARGIAFQRPLKIMKIGEVLDLHRIFDLRRNLHRRSEMQESPLNKNAVNQHAKHLLSLLDPDRDPEYLSPTETLSKELYLLRLIEWFLNQADPPYHPANEQMLQEKLAELMYEMLPQEAWTWLGMSTRHEAIQQAQTPRKGAFEATEVLRMQLFYVHQEMEEVIRTP